MAIIESRLGTCGLFPGGSPAPDYRRFEGREPDFEVTWDRRDLSLLRSR
jgi:hypothetical protein